MLRYRLLYLMQRRRRYHAVHGIQILRPQELRQLYLRQVQPFLTVFDHITQRTAFLLRRAVLVTTHHSRYQQSRHDRHSHTL